MLKQVLSSRANSSVKKYVAQYRLFCLYMKSRGLKLVLPCDSLLISEYLSNLHETKKSYAVVLSAFCALNGSMISFHTGYKVIQLILHYLATLWRLVNVYLTDQSEKRSLLLLI